MRTTSPILLSLLTACQVENKLFDIDPHAVEGECNIDSPPFVEDEDKPIAVCDSNRMHMAPLRDNAELFGDQSYDPNDLDLINYSWTLVERPTGSGLALMEQNSSSRTFTPDLAGEYVFELIVTNEECAQSDPCQLSIEATPEEDLWIELSWEHSGDDLDLHLIKEGSRFESDGDCYYANCVGDFNLLDWGQGGLLDDNPRLDLDDIDGVGPENINIKEPSQGSYTVMVHDYPGSEFSSGNTALVKIHLAGELEFERSIVITGEDSKTEIANILWPSLEIESLVD